MEKLEVLTDAAKYDVACTSSGVDRPAVPGRLGSAVKAGICHSFAADGRCISLLKVLLSNDCAFDCAYCVNRRTADSPRATFTPEELCRLTMEFYRRFPCEQPSYKRLSTNPYPCPDRSRMPLFDTRKGTFYKVP